MTLLGLFQGIGEGADQISFSSWICAVLATPVSMSLILCGYDMGGRSFLIWERGLHLISFISMGDKTIILKTFQILHFDLVVGRSDMGDMLNFAFCIFTCFGVVRYE